MIYFLLPNTKSITQPMNQGVTQNFKMFYRKEITRRLVKNNDNNELFFINILIVSIKISDKAWRRGTHRLYQIGS